MDQPPYKRPRMGLPPRPQFGLNNPGDWCPPRNTSYPMASQRSTHFGPPNPKASTSTSWSPPNSTNPGARRADAPKDESLTIFLSKEYQRCLCNVEGRTFRTVLADDLGVSINFVNPDAELVTCKLEGCSVNLEKAETAVITFCEKKKLKRKDVVPFFNTAYGERALPRNLQLLHSPSTCWFDRASELHGRIFELLCGDENEKQEKELASAYRQLNAIIICKLQPGDDYCHIEILEHSTVHNRDVVQRSFDYVFNTGRPIFPDYDALLAQLSNSVSKTELEEFKRWELEKLRRRAALICSRNRWTNEINILSAQYARIIVNGYQESHVAMFRCEYDKLEVRHAEAQQKKKLRGPKPNRPKKNRKNRKN